ncbi:MAG TPA: Wadjet anti-phage system protein JetD domain-containing protein [Pseudobacteroides sp.]|uniref:Wadjet anti-phage system protein JetD domain-containing protein n=1 Tax=Pseudobacteroides sp. TaxID=1968840 RepID=UPI002F9460E0
MDYRKYILEKLLYRYNKSAHSIGNASNHRVRIKLGPKSKDMKEYDIEDFEKKDLIHSAIYDLKEMKLIEYDWEPFDKKNVMSSVWLNLENIDLAYAITGKESKLQSLRCFCENIESLINDLSKINNGTHEKSNTSWIVTALEDILSKIEKNKKIDPIIPKTYDGLKEFSTALKEICWSSDKEVLERVFSLRCYGDTKHFENNIRSTLIKFIKKYSTYYITEDEGMAEEDILLSVGILRNPEIFEFCGPIILLFNDNYVDFNLFTQGAAINSDTLEIITNFNMQNITKVLFIENRSNFSHYIKNEITRNELVIYHGGFYSSSRGRFFKFIYQNAAKGTKFYHWGDIDLGGLSIFMRLKENIIPELLPYLMDTNTLESMKQYGKNYSPSYRNKLEQALNNTKFSEFYSTLQYMLDKGIRLEQEAFLLLR